MLSIGIIDNYMIVRMGLALILGNHCEDVELFEADSESQFSNLYKRKKLNMIIVGNNFESQHQCLQNVVSIRSTFPDTPVIVYDDHLKKNMALRYFKLGVSSYILRKNITTEMLNCVQSLQKGRQFLCPDLLDGLLKFIAHKDVTQPKAKSLTNREAEIAGYLSQGMKISWIAEVLGRKPSTISTVKYNIFRKMDVENIVELQKKVSAGMGIKYS